MIIIYTQCFPPDIGGIEDLVYNLALALHKAGKEVVVLADGKQEIASDFLVTRFSGPKFWRKIRKKRHIASIINRQKPEAIITDSWKSLEYLPKNALECKIISLAHGAEFSPNRISAGRQKRIIKALSLVTYVIANSEYTKSLVDKYLKNQKSLIINPGFNFSSLDLEKKKATPTLVTISRLEPRKGIDKIIKILPRLKKDFPDIAYKIAGNGQDMERLKKLANTCQISEQVEFLGFVSQEEKERLYQNAALFVMPVRIVGNSVEGFGIVYVEAAAYGVPAIGGREGGAASAIDDGKTGYLCDGNSEEEIYTKIYQLLNDQNLYQEFSANARQHAEKFRWDNIVKEYLRIIA